MSFTSNSDSFTTGQQRKKSSSSPFPALFGVLFLLFIGLVFLNSDIFAIKTVEIEGNQELSTEEILRITGLNRNRNIFQVNPSHIRESLLLNPQVAWVKATFLLPNSIIIQMKERQACCYLWYDAGFLRIGDDAVIMGVKEEDEPFHLPIITGVNLTKVKIGEKVSYPDFEAGLSIIGLIGDEFRPFLSEINLNEFQLFLETPNSSHTLKVLLGTGAELEKKIKEKLRAILTQNALDSLDKIDLRVPDVPIVVFR